MALTVRGDGTGTAFLVNSAWWNDYYDLLTGAMTDQQVTIANQVQLTSQNAKFYWGGTLAGSNKVVLDMKPTDSGVTEFQIIYKTNNHIAFWDATNSKTLIDFTPNAAPSFPLGLSATGTISADTFASGSGSLVVTSKQSGASNGIEFDTWSGTAKVVPFSVGGQIDSALAWVDASGGMHAQSYQTASGNNIPKSASAGGGSAGFNIWVGTTDPAGSASEGDIWIKA